MSALLGALLVAGLFDGLAQAMRGWRTALALLVSSGLALVIGHTWALELGLRGYTKLLLHSGVQDTAALFAAWALLLLLAFSLAAEAHPIKRVWAKGLHSLPSPLYLLALVLLQALMYQSVDGIAYAVLASGLMLFSSLVLMSAVFSAYRWSRDFYRLLRPATAFIALAVSVWLTASSQVLHTVPLSLALDSLAVLCGMAAALAAFGAVRHRHWL